ncbi:MAG TPA: hypothetical protein DCP63_07740 [Bacteroidetes bacterium]|nr:hypothetical protein [Bacteroidota bacterium]
MITSVPGFQVGHYTDSQAMTGCSVVLCPPRTRGSCEVRGNSPGSRELALLAPEKSMQEVHAILLSGGSAFGLAAADGVVKWLEGRRIGYQTPWAIVPIVPAAVVFDLNVGDELVRPDSSSGYKACEAASAGHFEEGNIGAGTGVTVGKWKGMEYWMKGGLGSTSLEAKGIIVGALAVVNSVGDVVGADGCVLAGARDRDGTFVSDREPHRPLARGRVLEQGNTTLVVAATNANLTKLDLFKVAQRMHDGVARSVIPAHTSYDGDVTFALSCGEIRSDLDLIAELAAQATSEAIRRGVVAAKSAYGVRGLAG